VETLLNRQMLSSRASFLNRRFEWHAENRGQVFKGPTAETLRLAQKVADLRRESATEVMTFSALDLRAGWSARVATVQAFARACEQLLAWTGVASDPSMDAYD
jgi:hypothetical protein